jgi:hypothetical protein
VIPASQPATRARARQAVAIPKVLADVELPNDASPAR